MIPWVLEVILVCATKCLMFLPTTTAIGCQATKAGHKKPLVPRVTR